MQQEKLGQKVLLYQGNRGFSEPQATNPSFFSLLLPQALEARMSRISPRLPLL